MKTDLTEHFLHFLKQEAEKQYPCTDDLPDLNFDEIIAGHAKILSDRISTEYAKRLVEKSCRSHAAIMLPELGNGPQDHYFIMPLFHPQEGQLVSVFVAEAKNPEKQKTFDKLVAALKSAIGDFVPEVGFISYADTDAGFEIIKDVASSIVEPEIGSWLASGILADWRSALSGDPKDYRTMDSVRIALDCPECTLSHLRKQVIWSLACDDLYVAGT